MFDLALPQLGCGTIPVDTHLLDTNQAQTMATGDLPPPNPPKVV